MEWKKKKKKETREIFLTDLQSQTSETVIIYKMFYHIFKWTL